MKTFSVDTSNAKLRQMAYKPWSAWNLPTMSSIMEAARLREINKPKEPDKPRDQCNLLLSSFLPIFGTNPEVEYFSVTKCPACRCVMKSQWMVQHFTRDRYENLVCKRTEMVVNGNRCYGKATSPLFNIKESAKDVWAEFSMLDSTTKAPAKTTKSSTVVSNITIPKLSPSQKPTSHKTESSTTRSSSGVSTSKSKSNSSSSHSKKHSSTSQSTSSSKHHKSSSLSPSSSATLSSSKKDSSKSHKHNTASYVLSIPSDDSSHNESVESILNSSKQTMQIITGKSKSSEPEYEQLKFYADSSDKRSRMLGEGPPDSKSHKLHFSPQLENFKIPLKNKSSSGSSHNADTSKKSKSSSSHSHSTKSTNDSTSKTFRHSSSSNSSSTVTKPVPSLTIISEAPKMNTPLISPRPIEVKEKSSSHSKKKKKKKSRDEPRKIIPLKERAFNPDQHCGVVSEDALPCTRSLTCKTHSIALRRSVPGRSHQFDSLLATHKKARDEEKAKFKEIAEDSKHKTKKANNSTPVPADSDSSSSSLPQPPSVGIKGTASGANSGKSGPASITFNTTSISSDSSTSNSMKHSSFGNVGAKTMSSHSQSLRQQTTKPAPTAKATNRPVIIVDDKKHTQGLTLFDLRREPENSFVYVSCVKAPKNLVNIKEVKISRSNALSEWNPSDRFFRKGVIGGVKKKAFKDPLVALLPFKVVNNGVPILVDTQGKDITSCIGDTELCVDGNDGRTTVTSARSTICLKRKSGSVSSDAGMVSAPKRTRLLHSTHQFYESLLYKTVQKPECTIKILTRSEVGSSAKGRSSDGGTVAGEGTDVNTQSIIDEHSSLEFDDPRSTPRSIYDSLSIEAREFLQSYVKTHSNRGSLDKVTLSEEEMCQYAFELINKCVLS